MSVVTNATVEYSRMTRPGDFEHRNPKVSFSIQFDDGEDFVAVTREVMSVAVELAEEAATGKISVGEVAERVAATERPKRGRPAAPKVEPAKVTQVDAAEASGSTHDRSEPVAGDDMGGGPTAGETTASGTPAPATSEIEPISDKALQAACAPISEKMRKQTAAKDGGPGNITALVELIHTAAGGDDKGLSNIPQDKRAQFIADAKMLVADAPAGQEIPL